MDESCQNKAVYWYFQRCWIQDISKLVSSRAETPRFPIKKIGSVGTRNQIVTVWLLWSSGQQSKIGSDLSGLLLRCIDIRQTQTNSDKLDIMMVYMQARNLLISSATLFSRSCLSKVGQSQQKCGFHCIASLVRRDAMADSVEIYIMGSRGPCRASKSTAPYLTLPDYLTIPYLTLLYSTLCLTYLVLPCLNLPHSTWSSKGKGLDEW